ncbi:hypothetical protein HC928_01700 [bacterium]|nr:hypothetical protein [bacterium]
MMDADNIVPAEIVIDEQTTIRVQAIGQPYGDVSGGGIPKGVIEQITQNIVKLSQPIGAALQESGAKRASVEYGVQLAVEGGSLIATFLSIGGQVNMKVTLEFEA